VRHGEENKRKGVAAVAMAWRRKYQHRAKSVKWRNGVSAKAAEKAQWRGSGENLAASKKIIESEAAKSIEA